MSPPVDRRWFDEVYKRQSTQADSVHKTAESWRNGLTGLTALFAIVTIAKGPQALGDLSDSRRTLVVILAALAFVALVTGSLLAMQAAFGIPEEKADFPEDLMEWNNEEARRSKRWMIKGIVVFLIGLTLVATATGVAWTAPEPKDKPYISAVVEGETICGKPAGSKAGNLILKPDKGDSRSVALADIDSLSLTAKCP